jgi:pantothenate kinase
MSEVIVEAAQRLTDIGEGLKPVIEQEENDDLRNLLGYFVSIIPTTVALMESDASAESTALALSILGKTV